MTRAGNFRNFPARAVSGAGGIREVMPKFLLHGLWLHESGLAIWAERVEGHRIITMDQVPAGTFPPIVHSLLDGQRFRHREEGRSKNTMDKL